MQLRPIRLRLWCGGVLDEFCENLTEDQCEAKEPDDTRRIWQRGRYCDEGDQHCALGNCAQVRSGPGCWDEECHRHVCSEDSWCCDIEWDELCVRAYGANCSGRSLPLNAFCSLDPNRPWYPFVFEALSVEANSTVAVSNVFARMASPPTGFFCYERTELRCVGGTLDGRPCEFDAQCRSAGVGTCEDLPVLPVRQGRGDIWFKFVATEESARVHTCETSGPVTDTIIQVYAAEDNSSTEAACNTLVPIGCNDFDSGCSNNPFLAELCVWNLVIGETYYIKVAGSTDSDRGLITLSVESPCGDPGDHPPPALPTSPARGVAGAPPASGNHAEDEAEVVVQNMGDEPEWDQGEVPYDPPVAKPIDRPAGVVSQGGRVERDGYVSIQVNVDAFGNNIVGDAANEPSIAVDPSDPTRIVIGWRQFDTVTSNFRQAGWGYSHDAGRTWTFPGVLEDHVFRSDPVVAASSEGIFYYYSLTDDFTYDLFTSFDGGVTWPRSIPAAGGDKGWMIVDTTGGPGDGNIYMQWTGSPGFTRSTDGGATVMNPVPGGGVWGMMAVGLDGALYTTGRTGGVGWSEDAWNSKATPTFSFLGMSGAGGGSANGAPNPGGLLGQNWVAVDHSSGPTRGNIYALGTDVIKLPDSRAGNSRVMFGRSEDRGETWSFARAVDADSHSDNSWQWFGTMSVAPNGRIDVIWNDTRNSGQANRCELYYSSSDDGGNTWLTGTPISPMFDSHVGWPNQSKLGDYYHMVSDNQGANLAYAATFNGEQDVYYLRIGPKPDCNENGLPDREDVTTGRSQDCDGDFLPDECERNFDGDEFIDDCDTDLDGDGIANKYDVCGRTGLGVPATSEGRPRGDTTGNCDLDLSDYWRFRNCVVKGRRELPALREACLAAFDYDLDRQLTLRDFAVFQNGFEASSR